MKMSSEDMQKKIILEPNYLLEQIDNEITLYHPTLTTSLYLNESGGLIWELCNGERSTADIIDLITAAYPENSQQIEGDVTKVITQLLENNIATLQE